MSKVIANEFRLPGNKLVYDQTNIVGTVSQAVGEPTGAIIESGSNANGEYVKYADGTLIMRRAVPFPGYGSGTRTVTVTFPVARSVDDTAPGLILARAAWGQTYTAERIQSHTTTTAECIIDVTSVSAGDVSMRLIIIARWYE